MSSIIDTLTPYKKAVETIRTFVENGGNIHSEELCDENLVSVLIKCYYEEYGMHTTDPDNEQDGYWLNPKRETELPLHKRDSGIVYELEWIKEHGFDFKEDCNNYLKDITIDRFDSPVVTASCYNMDPYLFEYCVNNGYRDLLYVPIDPEEEDDSQAVIEWIWDDVDLQTEEFNLYKKDGYDSKPSFENAARMLKMLIYYGCKSREGFIVKVWPDLRISFPGPRNVF